MSSGDILSSSVTDPFGFENKKILGIRRSQQGSQHMVASRTASYNFFQSYCRGQCDGLHVPETNARFRSSTLGPAASNRKGPRITP